MLVSFCPISITCVLSAFIVIWLVAHQLCMFINRCLELIFNINNNIIFLSQIMQTRVLESIKSDCGAFLHWLPHNKPCQITNICWTYTFVHVLPGQWYPITHDNNDQQCYDAWALLNGMGHELVSTTPGVPLCTFAYSASTFLATLFSVSHDFSHELSTTFNKVAGFLWCRLS